MCSRLGGRAIVWMEERKVRGRCKVAERSMSYFRFDTRLKSNSKYVVTSLTFVQWLSS